MGLETIINTIADLNVTYPLDGDLASQGDNHIRLIKDAVVKTFPNINVPITGTPAELNKLAGLVTTKAELGFVAGVTSAIQAQINAAIADIATLVSGAVPVGTVTEYAGSTTPAGRWYLCQGQAIPRIGTNAALFVAIGTTYGAGDGSTRAIHDTGNHRTDGR